MFDCKLLDYSIYDDGNKTWFLFICYIEDMMNFFLWTLLLLVGHAYGEREGKEGVVLTDSLTTTGTNVQVHFSQVHMKVGSVRDL